MPSATSIRIRYVVDGKSFDFPYDLKSDTHRQRVMNLLLWAARAGVTLKIEPAAALVAVSVA